LRIKIAANSWNGSIADLQRVLNSVALASPGTLLFVQDKFDMSMVLGVAGNVPSTLFVSLLRTVYSWIRPATVNIAQVAVTSVSGGPMFGFDVENAYISGFDVGAIALNY
jgi:hypothetical protein